MKSLQKVASVILVAISTTASGFADPAPTRPVARDAPAPEPGSLSMDQAVALALQRNRDVIRARLDVREAEFDLVAAQMYPNPALSYQAGNLVLGHGNPYNARAGAPQSPGFFSQVVHSVGISEIIDVWAKRSARRRAAEESIRLKRLELLDALREIAYAVRSAFADVLREQSEHAFAYEVRDRYARTVQLSRSRYQVGEISEAEFRKIELEGLKYQSAVVDAEAEYQLARQKLALLLAFPSASVLPERLSEPVPLPVHGSIAELTARALQNRPDVLAAKQERKAADLELAAARREAYPDLSVGVTYTHSEFGVSGDNPNTLAFGASVPLPLFDRNQAGIGRAEVGQRRALNDRVRAELQVQSDVAGALSRFKRAEALLDLFRSGGMMERAETALKVAEQSYKAGALSLLELLEAQRTYLETRDEYLRARYDQQQSTVDLSYAIGRTPE